MTYRMLLGALGLLAAVSVPARADLRYTTLMTFGEAKDSPAGQGNRTTTFVKDNNERVEMVMKIGPMEMKTVSLNLCAKNQAIQLDPDLKLYTVKPLNAAVTAPTPPAAGYRAAQPRPADGKPATGKVVMTYNVQDLGTEKVLNLDTRHVMVTMRTQSSGCVGDGDTTMKMEIWTAPIKTVNCPSRWAGTAASGPADGGDGDCKVAYEFRGDMDKAKDIFSGMVVQQKMYQGDKVVSTQTLREHSLAALDASLFTVPADFRKVTEAEFQKARQDAMRKNMMRNIGKDAENVDEPAEAGPEPAEDAAKQEEKPKPKIRLPKLPF